MFTILYTAARSYEIERRCSLLDLVVAQTADEATLVKNTLRKIIDDRETHSMFSGIALAQTRRTAMMPEGAVEGVSEDGRKFTRSLMHLTPLKDGKVSVVVYSDD